MATQTTQWPVEVQNVQTRPSHRFGAPYSQGTNPLEIPLQDISNGPRQYAYPAQHASTQGSSSNDNGYLSFAERQMRRKTPKGTIDNAYDATPVDKAVQMPASKHLILSPLPSPGFGPSQQSAFSSRPWQQRYNKDGFLDQRSPSLYSNSTYENRPRHGQLPVESATAYPPAWQFPGGIDSVLNQTLPFHPSQRYYLQYGSTVPTVLPATTQAYAGPAVSAGSGLYGPYWPDGAYIPYRPASIRDDRYYSNDFGHDTANTSPRYHPAHRPHASYQHSQQYGQANPNAHNAYSSNVSSFGQFSQHLHDVSQADLHRPHHGQQTSLATIPRQHQGRVPLELPTKDYEPFWQGQPNSLDFARDFQEGISDAVSKEKIFSWAHSNYVDLLAVLQQNPKTSPYSSNGQMQHSSKPKFYPKPPRQPGLDFSASMAAHQHKIPSRTQAAFDASDRLERPPTIDDL